MYVCPGKLEMKIPWKRLTKDPLVITIDEVYVILGPNIGACVVGGWVWHVGAVFVAGYFTECDACSNDLTVIRGCLTVCFRGTVLLI